MKRKLTLRGICIMTGAVITAVAVGFLVLLTCRGRDPVLEANKTWNDIIRGARDRLRTRPTDEEIRDRILDKYRKPR
jgi:hypothetical protein